MDDYCKKFKGGYCEKIGKHVMISHCRRCLGKQGEEKKYPPLKNQAISVTKAFIAWQNAGRPVRSQQEIRQIEKICNSCEQLNDKGSRCFACGCFLKKKRLWATAFCDLGYWFTGFIGS